MEHGWHHDKTFRGRQCKLKTTFPGRAFLKACEEKMTDLIVLLSWPPRTVGAANPSLPWREQGQTPSLRALRSWGNLVRDTARSKELVWSHLKLRSYRQKVNASCSRFASPRYILYYLHKLQPFLINTVLPNSLPKHPKLLLKYWHGEKCSFCDVPLLSSVKKIAAERKGTATTLIKIYYLPKTPLF